MEYTPGNNHSVSLSGQAEDEEVLRGYWDRLSEGATVAAPLEPAPWGDLVGPTHDAHSFGIRIHRMM